jgi:hypothetical protein
MAAAGFLRDPPSRLRDRSVGCQGGFTELGPAEDQPVLVAGARANVLLRVKGRWLYGDRS